MSPLDGRLQERLQGIQRAALAVGAGGALLLVAGAFFSPRQFFSSYLLGYLFWLGIPLGSMGLLMLHHLTGGGWGVPIRRPLEAALRTLPVVALLWLPLIAGMSYLYPWSRPELVAADHVLEAKAIYLNAPFFLLRAALYFGIWLLMGHLLNRWSGQQDETGAGSLGGRFRALSAPGLVLYGGTATFASIDWVMSLEPHWFSTIYGLLFIVGQVLTTLAVMVVVVNLLRRYPPLSGVVTDKHFHDLGNMILAFVMLWAYMGFSQYLIIWSGNLPEEIPWYLHRTGGSWQTVALLLVLFHFAVPFLLLLSRNNKRRGRALTRLALGMLGMRLVDLFWTVVPSLHTGGLALHWMDAVAPLALGGIWVMEFARQLGKAPLLPLQGPAEGAAAAAVAPQTAGGAEA